MHENRRIDPTERAHLRDAAGYSPPIHRFAPTPGLAGLVRRYWMPVWSLPEGARSVKCWADALVAVSVMAPRSQAGCRWRL